MILHNPMKLYKLFAAMHSQFKFTCFNELVIYAYLVDWQFIRSNLFPEGLLNRIYDGMI